MLVGRDFDWVVVVVVVVRVALGVVVGTACSGAPKVVVLL